MTLTYFFQGYLVRQLILSNHANMQAKFMLAMHVGLAEKTVETQ